jgi:hypothetical protein
MEPCGVTMLDSLDTDATEEMQKKGLKYSKPDISDLEIGNYLSHQELGFFVEHLQHFPDDSNVW